MMAQLPNAHNNLSNSYQRTPSAELTGIFNDADLSIVQIILQHLSHIQIKAGVQHRFHLILESQVNDTRDTSLPCSYFLFQRPTNVSTRVLFSPTLSPSVTCGFERSRLDTLVRSLNEISYHAMPPSQFLSAQPVAHHQNRQGTHHSVPFPGMQNPSPISPEEEELRNVGTIRIPTWFPFLGTEYTKPPQFSHEKLVIDPAIAGKFGALNNDDISLLYRVFFEFLHRHARKKSQKYKQSMLKYSMFTPPWLRRQFVVGGLVVLMPKVVLPDQRENRNKMGYKRMALILSGFYMNEPYFGKYVLEYLFGRLPDIKRESERRRQVRHAPLTSFGHTRTEKRLRPPQKFTRQVKPHGDTTIHSDAGEHQQATDDVRLGIRAPGNTGSKQGSDHRMGEIRGNRNLSSETGSVVPSEDPTCSAPKSITPRVQQSRREPLLQRKQVHKPGRSRAPSRKLCSVRSTSEPRADDNLDTVTSSAANSATPSEDSDLSEPTGVEVQKPQDHGKAPPITCGAGSNCMFVKDSSCQDVDAMTGKCSKCDHPLHDLCGGGEEGDMLCNNCTQ